MKKFLFKGGFIVLITALFASCNGGMQPTSKTTTHTHQWGAWSVTTSATCISKGVESRVCALDALHKETRDTPIDQNAHQWANNWTTTGSTATDTCKLNTSHIRTRISSVTDLGTYLSSLPANTAATAYTVKLDVSSLGGGTSTSGSVGAILRNNSTKFISLDLSGSTLTSIEDDAFNGLANLTGIILPSGVTSIGDRSFNRCTSLTSLIIPDGVTSIGDTAFNDCRNLTSITIPNTITSIGDGAFAFCAGLAGITIPNKVTSIGFGVYQRCDSLTSIIIPSSVTSIGEKAFNTNAKLTSVTFQGTIASGNFHNDAFQNDGDLRAKFYAANATNGTPGTYTTTAPVSASSVWTKQ